MKKITINNKYFDVKKVVDGEIDHHVLDAFETDVLEVVNTWYLNKKNFKLQSSGSTGLPKTVTFSRAQLRNSAWRTIEYFNLKKGNRVLLCLSPKFVAGFMMVIRALEGGLELVAIEPTNNPLTSIPDLYKFQLASFTPIQLEKILHTTPEKLTKIEKILVGGVGISPQLEKEFENYPAPIYHSFGMTETLTHIAMRSLTGKNRSKLFTALKGVTFDVDERSCLIIHDNILKIQALTTNDIVELIDDRSFYWKGRFDNIINSGGIKILLEKLETDIGQILQEMSITQKHCLIAQEDSKLTNRMIMLLEQEHDEIDTKNLLKVLKAKLPTYHDPKMVIKVPKIALTKSGKIDREENIRRYLNNNRDKQ